MPVAGGELTPIPARRWFEGTVVVAVTDGRLTVSNGTGAVNNKIAYVDLFMIR